MADSMSVISGVNTASQAMLQNLFAQQNKENAPASGAASGNAASKAANKMNTASGKYSSPGVSSEAAQAAVKKALAEMQADGEKHITFEKIAAYQKKLEEEFSTTVRADIYKLGVSLETEFSINMSSEGNISVNCADPAAKKVIEKYLSDNPKVCEQFGYIQALANVDRASRSPAALGTNLRDVKAGLQASAVEAFMSDALSSGVMDYSGLLADFGGSAGSSGGAGAAKFYAGLNFKV